MTPRGRIASPKAHTLVVCALASVNLLSPRAHSPERNGAMAGIVVGVDASLAGTAAAREAGSSPQRGPTRRRRMTQ
jgi:hypothetical protein